MPFGTNNNYSNQQYQGNGRPSRQPSQQANTGYAPQQGPMPSAMDLLATSSAKGFFSRDSQPGTSVTGTVESFDAMQTHDYQTGQPNYWNDGTPQMQFHIVVQTGLREPDVDDDDGRRSIYIKAWGIQKKALLEACRQAGAKGPKPGDTFTATFTGYDPQSKNPSNPAKMYEYRLEPGSAAQSLLNGGRPQQQSHPQQTQQRPQQPQGGPVYSQQRGIAQQGQPAQQYRQPAQDVNQGVQGGMVQQAAPQQFQQQPAQPRQSQPMPVNPQQVAQLQAIGKTPEEIAGLLGTSPDQVNAVLGQQTAPEPDDLGF